jgi:hypothetical protein
MLHHYCVYVENDLVEFVTVIIILKSLRADRRRVRGGDLRAGGVRGAAHD